MNKEFAEKQEIEVHLRKTVCDLCGDVIPEGAIKLRIAAANEVYERSDRPTDYPSNSDPIDICNSECLRKNLSGLLLTLQSKIIPSMEEKVTARKTIGRRSYSEAKEDKAEAATPFFSLREIAASIKLER